MVLDNATTACICDEIAQELMMTPKEREILYYSALVHDIGMLAVPRDIVDAPRKLEKEEMRLVRSHVELANKVLKDRMKKDVIRIALMHHERSDGSGYPLRLKESQMNVSQRILQVADMVTALVNKRSYHKDLSKEDIIDILNAEVAKNRLKKQVVVAFVKSYDRIMKHVREGSADITKMYETINMQYELISKKYKI